MINNLIFRNDGGKSKAPLICVPFFMVHVLVLFIFVWWCVPGEATYGDTFSRDITPRKFYDTYEKTVVYNTTDDSIYWGLKYSSQGHNASTGFTRKAVRYTLEDTSYYVDTRSAASDYNECITELDGDYFYNYCRIKLSTLLELFAEKYPSVDFKEYFSGKYTIEIDALMAIRVKNVYQCYDDLTDGKTPRGMLYSAKAKATGESAYKNLYTSAKSMQTAYSKYANVSFDSWYDRFIDITPNNPAADVDYDIKVDDLTITGGNNYRFNSDIYYVKASENFTLSFTSKTYQNGTLKANATYQPSVNGIITTQTIADRYNNVSVYKYYTSPFGANVTTFSTYATYDTVYNLVTVTQTRSSNLTTLSTSLVMNMSEVNYTPKFSSMSRLMVAGKMVKSDTSEAIAIIPDGTPPDIKLQDSYEFNKDEVEDDIIKLSIPLKDELSGVRRLEIYNEKGQQITSKYYSAPQKLTGLTAEFDGKECIGTYKAYTIKAWDAVGNEAEKIIKIKYNKKIFTKPNIVGTH